MMTTKNPVDTRPGRRRMRRFFRHANAALTITLLLTVARGHAAETHAGEFSIPPVTPLAPLALAELRQLAGSDEEARALAAAAAAEAAPLLDTDPRPLEVIHYEGLVHTDPRRIACVMRLRDMGDVARLLRHWQASGDTRAAAALLRHITAWAAAYRVTGNDVNENKLYPLLAAWHALRASAPRADCETVDAWVERLGRAHLEAVERSERFTNRYAKSVRLLHLCGLILDHEDWTARADGATRLFVSQSLRSDGTSEDLRHRDSLTYHASALTPILELALLSGERGAALYDWTSPRGASLRRAVDYVVPYAMGTKTREEWTHSRVGLDRRRAEAGLARYQPGRTYERTDALELMERASHFDPSLLEVVRHLTGSRARRFPTWQTLVNAAAGAGL